MMRLTPEDVARYQREGFVGPFRGWAEDEIAETTERLLARGRALGLDGDRPLLNRHTEIREIAELATRRQVVDRLVSLLGPNLLLFQTSLSAFTPTRPGPLWHQHVYPDWNPQPSSHCVVRIALTAEPPGNCHAFIPASALPADAGSLDEILRRVSPEFMVSIPLRPGEFVVFDGTLPHCAANTKDDRAVVSRLALVMRVACPSTHLGRFADTGRCVVLRGRNEPALNRCSVLAGATGTPPVP